MSDLAAFPNRRAACRAMRADGLRPDEIAEVGRTLDALDPRDACGRFAPRPRRPRQLMIPAAAFDAIAGAAAARRIAPSELAARLLETIAEEQLVDAVLDDGRIA